MSDGSVVCVWEADEHAWRWARSRVVDGNDEPVAACGEAVWTSAADAKRAALDAFAGRTLPTVLDRARCPLCGSAVLVGAEATLDGQAAIRLWRATATALNAAPPATRIAVARAIERAANGASHAEILAAFTEDAA